MINALRSESVNVESVQVHECECEAVSVSVGECAISLYLNAKLTDLFIPRSPKMRFAGMCDMC